VTHRPARGTRGCADVSSPRRRGSSDLVLAPSELTLGILAGGRASRLGGRDKAWLQRDGVPQILRIARRFNGECATVQVSANRELPRYGEHGLVAIEDRIADMGPLGGIDALASACTTPWLLTLPVDIVDTNDCLLRTLANANADGAVAEDDDGLQPLVALYRVAPLHDAVAAAIAANDFSVQAMQARMRLPRVRFNGLRFGNLNTPDDLRLAGYADD